MKVGADQGVISANDVELSDDDLEKARRVLHQTIKNARRALTMEANQS